MIRVLITTAVMLGMGNLHIPTSLGGQVISSESDKYIDFIKTEYHPWEKDSPGVARLQFNLYFVQRESTKPPSGSHSGRASSSPAGSVPESKRDSGRHSDLAQGDSAGNLIKDALKATRQSQRTLKRKHDPTTGGGRSPAGFDRRGGAR
jgi:hypothetical protein